MNKKSIFTTSDEETSKNESKEVKLTPIQQNINEAWVDYSQPRKPPPSLLYINGRTVGTLGNFSLFTGKPKSKKTFLCSLLIGSTGNQENSETIEVKLPDDKHDIIFFDTEQSTHKVIEVAHRICKLRGVDPPDEHLKVFSLRQFTPKERIFIIEEVLKIEQNTGLVIIDGTRDLVNSINSEEESTHIASYLLKWSKIHDIHIINVLHQNKTDSNARGHLGTELINKAETTLEVVSQGNGSSVVQCLFAREKEFHPFSFSINEHALPVITEGNIAFTPSEQTTFQRKVKPEDLTDEKCKLILKEVSSLTDDPKFSVLIDAIKVAVEEVTGESIGDTKAKKFKIFLEEQGGIQQQGKEGTRNSYYTIHPDSIN